MTIEVITREDLNQFRFLLNDLKDILDAKPQQQKRWLKSSEVKELLGISSGTLHNCKEPYSMRWRASRNFSSKTNLMLTQPYFNNDHL